MNTPVSGCIAHLQTNREWGGGENQVLQLLRALRLRNVDAVLWADSDGALFDRAVALDLPVHALPVGSGTRNDRRGFRTLCDSLRAAGVSVLHAHDSVGLSLGIRLRRKLGVPLVYNRRVASPIRSNWFSQRKYSPRRIDAVIAISQTVRQTILNSCRYPADQIFIAPTGVDVEALSAVAVDRGWRARVGGEWIAGGLGRLASKKNWAFLVETAAVCRKRLPQLRWVVAGEGPERDALESLAKQRGVDDIVEFIGFQPEGSRLLKSLDLLFFPSLREGASVTIREAMVMGVPVAAMNAAGSMESLDGHGWILEPDKVTQAAETVRHILGDASGRKKVVQSARESAIGRFSFSRTASDTLAVYNRLLSLWTGGGACPTMRPVAISPCTSKKHR